MLKIQLPKTVRNSVAVDNFLAGIDERDAPDGDYLTSREQIGEALADFAKRDS